MRGLIETRWTCGATVASIAAVACAPAIQVYTPGAADFSTRSGTLGCTERARQPPEPTTPAGRFVESLRPKFSRCYQSFVQRGGGLSGTACVRLVIGSGGAVAL